MDPLLCLEDDIKKAQNNKEIVVAMFVDVEKAYDMPWRKGLLIKLHQLGIGENMFSWLRDFFLCDRTIQVKIGSRFRAKKNRKWNSSRKCSKPNVIFSYDQWYF